MQWQDGRPDAKSLVVISGALVMDQASGLYKSTDPGGILLACDEINGYGQASLLGERGACRLELVVSGVQGFSSFFWRPTGG